MVEAVMALPIFIILFAGVIHVRAGAVATQQLDEKARSCAWRYSKNGCSRIPEGCAVHEEAPPEISDQRMSHALASVETAAASGTDADGFVYKLAGQLIAPELNSAFGRTAVADPVMKVARQIFFGGGENTIGARYQISCNLQRKEPLDVAKDAWNMARGKEKDDDDELE